MRAPIDHCRSHNSELFRQMQLWMDCMRWIMRRLKLMVQVLALSTVVVTLVCPSAEVSARPRSQYGPSLNETLRAAAAYLEVFPLKAAGLLVQEDYSQQLHTTTVMTRHLRSDVLIMPDPDNGWLEFRDVFEVDGRPVRDRTDRLADLFARPRGDTREQMRRIVAEGARFNLDAIVAGRTVSRTLNAPTAAMWFLRGINQKRSSFTAPDRATVAERAAAVVRFRETTRPRIIHTNNGAAARGAFWIDLDTGAVLRSEFSLANLRDGIQTEATIRVDYAFEPAAGIWMPRAMDEHYEISTDDPTLLPVSPTLPGRGNSSLAGNITVDGQASYSHVRHFDVTVVEQNTQ